MDFMGFPGPMTRTAVGCSILKGYRSVSGDLVALLTVGQHEAEKRMSPIYALLCFFSSSEKEKDILNL
jgi:hypothetical protein